MSGDNKQVLLGWISGAHGIRGDVILRSHTEDPGAIGDYGPLVSKDGKRSFEIKVRRVTAKGVVAKVKGVDDRNGAEALKGVELFVSRDQLGDADEGSFFYSDLVGLKAVGPEGDALGEVVAVENFGAGDLLEVRFKGAKQTQYVSFTHEFVPVVDVDGGRVVIDLPAEDDASDDAGDNDNDESGSKR